MEKGYSIKPVKKIFGFFESLLFIKAIFVIIIGHVIGNLIMGAIAIEGQKTGVPTMVLSRGALGIKDSFLPSKHMEKIGKNICNTSLFIEYMAYIYYFKKVFNPRGLSKKSE